MLEEKKCVKTFKGCFGDHVFFVLMFFFKIPYFTSFIQLLTWQNASCMYYSLWGSKVYKKRNVPKTLIIQRYASTNLPRPPLLWSKKNDGQSFECSILMPTSNLLTYELPHTSLSSSTKPIISKGSSQNSSQSPMGKGAQYNMGCFSSSWDVHICMGCAPLFNGCSYLLWTPFFWLQSWILLSKT
jgi:hypothetical protein